MSEPNLDKQVSKVPLNSGLWVARQTDKWTVKTHWPPNGEDATEDLMNMGEAPGVYKHLCEGQLLCTPI